MVTAVGFEPRDQRQRYDGGQQRKSAWNGTVPLLFLRIIEVLTNPTKGETLISSGMIEANPVSHIQEFRRMLFNIQSPRLWWKRRFSRSRVIKFWQCCPQKYWVVTHMVLQLVVLVHCIPILEPSRSVKSGEFKESTLFSIS